MAGRAATASHVRREPWRGEDHAEDRRMTRRRSIGTARIWRVGRGLDIRRWRGRIASIDGSVGAGLAMGRMYASEMGGRLN